MNIEGTLEQRGREYGSFVDQSVIAQAIKAAFRMNGRWNELAPDQREALDHIAVKVSRILNGNQDHFDSWHDIGGYAQLVARRLSA
jgi:hypothetical protein